MGSKKLNVHHKLKESELKLKMAKVLQLLCVLLGNLDLVVH